MQLLNQFLFGVFPYIALAVLVLGSVLRFDREQYTWRTGSSQLLRRKQLMLGSVLFHVGILTIFGGHFVGLLTPIWVFDALGVPHGAKQILAIVAGGLAGVLCLVGGLLLLHRRLFDPRIRATSSFGDTAILVLLLAQLILGLATIPLSAGHLDGHEMLKFMSWAQGVFTFRPGVAAYVADVHPIFKAHLVLGMTILLVFPFTRLVHMLSAPVWYLNRRGWQLVRTKRALPLRKVAAAPVYPTEPVSPGARNASIQAVRPEALKAAE
ncbi:MAG: respiratory nitrate reductase subunit gamma [Phenylobacterium sp.]|jgi:nitrate reductase gamma subunit|nr:respiratory nitrate reductase subunit gamma [Phenylobacterium sp.]MDZ4320011.1 respiratory nitrate reductase subunit gamma [Phenylobacterium sp.]